MHTNPIPIHYNTPHHHNSLDNRPVAFPKALHKGPLLSTSLDVPYDDVDGVVRVQHHVAKGHHVPLTGGEVNVLHPLVLKLADAGELGRPPQCHTQLVESGQVGSQRGPVQVGFCPTLEGNGLKKSFF